MTFIAGGASNMFLSNAENVSLFSPLLHSPPNKIIFAYINENVGNIFIFHFFFLITLSTV